jgi:phosphoglycerate dehydrogenase-like enzyme
MPPVSVYWNPERPLRILLSEQMAPRLDGRIRAILGPSPYRLVTPALIETDAGAAADIAFISRDVTGLSTKHRILPDTQRFYDAMLASPALRWVNAHSAGADRAIFGLLRERGVTVTTSTGANANVVAQSALAGVLALARRFPQMAAAQRAHRWEPLIGSGLPLDLEGQAATLVGWGAIGQALGRLLLALGLKLTVVRQSAQHAISDASVIGYEDFRNVLPATDWLILACPLTGVTRSLVDARALALLPPSAHVVNVARGEVIDEDALIEALRTQRLAGAFLDVFAQEPLPADSPLWDMQNVIATPHSAGFSSGNEERVASMFLDNLARIRRGEPLLRVAP